MGTLIRALLLLPLPLMTGKALAIDLCGDLCDIVEGVKDAVERAADNIVRESGKVLPAEVRGPLETIAKTGSKEIQSFGGNTLMIVRNGGQQVGGLLQTASGDVIATVEKAGKDTVATVAKAGEDTVKTYVKGWRDTADQTKRSLEDATEAAQATARYVERQANDQLRTLDEAQRDARQGKIIGAMWKLSVEPLRATERNAGKATQESKVINAAAASAAATYGGPAGAAAYAAWSTYRTTGDANLAMRMGVLAAITQQTGGGVSSLPSGTLGETVKKAAFAGAAGGIAVAAAGGDEAAIKESFLKSGGAVLVQGGTESLAGYSPKGAEAVKTVQCISARDLDCLSNITYTRDAAGKIQHTEDQIHTLYVSSTERAGKWIAENTNTDAAKIAKVMTQVSKLPKSEIIPLIDNQWVLTTSLGMSSDIPANRPAVVLTYVGENKPFVSRVTTSKRAASSGTYPLHYNCRIGQDRRSIDVAVKGTWCQAIYRREAGNQVIWESDHHPEICAPQAAEQVKKFAKLGIACKP